jgi:hypothetical protein
MPGTHAMLVRRVDLHSPAPSICWIARSSQACLHNLHALSSTRLYNQCASQHVVKGLPACGANDEQRTNEYQARNELTGKTPEGSANPYRAAVVSDHDQAEQSFPGCGAPPACPEPH